MGLDGTGRRNVGISITTVCAPNAETNVSITKIKIPCNWSQIQEGQIDSAHSSTLHSSDMVPARVESAGANNTHWTRPSTDKSPRIFTQRTPYGFRYVAVRRPIKNARTNDYLRITVYVAPFISLIPPNDSYNVCSIMFPRTTTIRGSTLSPGVMRAVSIKIRGALSITLLSARI